MSAESHPPKSSTIDVTYEPRRCAVPGCPTQFLTRTGAPDPPACCDRHDFAVREVEGLPIRVGTRTELVARNVERVGLFAAIVSRYEQVEVPVFGTPTYETWIDPETGQRMGRKLGVRRWEY